MLHSKRFAFRTLAFVVTCLILAGCPSPMTPPSQPPAPEQVAAPTFSPPSGTYTVTQHVSISSTTAGASIRYTTGGSLPTETVGTLYSAPVDVAATETLNAIAYLSGWSDSTVASAVYTITGTVATPAFSPVGGAYSTDQSVTISCATGGAAIYYTTDTSTPTASSTPYVSPISVAGNGTNETIKAIAINTGMTDSAVATATYVITYAQVSTPTFSPAGNTYSTDQSVTISCATVGAAIYYTTDDSTPTESSTLYAAPIPVAGNGTNETIRAIAIKNGMTGSAVGSSTYSILYRVAAPVFSPTPGGYTSDQAVTISCSTPGASIYYTTSSTAIPTASSTPYTGPISVSGNGITRFLNAIAIKAGMADSSVVSVSYSIFYPTVATPTFSPAAGTYAGDQSVAISCSTLGATIYYTINGSNPTTSSAVYASPIQVAGNGVSKTIRAIGIKSAMTNSSIAVAAYSIYNTWQAFGTMGTGTNQVENPYAVVVDANGHIFISDMGNNRIVRIDDMSGTNWTAYSPTFGNGANQLAYPFGIAVDPAGRIYIADTQNSRIVRIDDLNGTNWTPLTGSGLDQFNRPIGIVLDASGRICVTDAGNRVVRVDDMTGANWTTFGSSGSGIHQFNYPTGIALDGSGRIHVTDANNNRIVRIDDMAGTNWITFGSSGNGINQFRSPFGLGVDPGGHISVADTGNIRIVRINDMSGTNWTTFGTSGSGINQFKNPTSAFAGAGGYLYVADTQGYRIVRFVLP